ncbi:MFS transporter [Actinopolymorpha pittospori]
MPPGSREPDRSTIPAPAGDVGATSPLSDVAERSTDGPAATPTPTRAGLTLLTTCLATLVALMNYTAPMTVLQQTAAGLHAGVTGQTWILNGIALGLAALLLVAGSLADNHGRRRMFVAGALLSVVAGVACATAGTTLIFVIARVVQGGATAAIIVATLGIIGHEFPPGPARARASALWGAMLGAGIALGPLLAGVLTQLLDWRATYWAYAAAFAVLAVLGALTLAESRAVVRRRADLAGVLTLGPGLAALLAAVTSGRQGWTQPLVLVLFGAAVVMLASFVLVEARVREPMLDLGLFSRPAFLLSLGGALVTGLAVIGVMSYLPAAWQRTLGWTPLVTAGWFALWSGTAFLAALQSRRLRLAPRNQLILGLGLAAAGSLLLLGSAGHWSDTRDVIALVIAGAGSGLLNSALARLAIESVPHGRASMGSGANNTARYIGSSLGVAITVAVVTTAAGPRGNVSHGVDVALVVAAAIALVGAALTLGTRAEAASSGH